MSSVGARSKNKTWGEIGWDICAILCLIGCGACAWWFVINHSLWSLLLTFVMGIAVATCCESSQRCAIGYRGHTYEQFPLVTVLFWIMLGFFACAVYASSLLRKLTWVGYLVIAIIACIATALIMIVSNGNTTGSVLAICTGCISFGALLMAIAWTCPQKAPPNGDPCCEGTCDS